MAKKNELVKADAFNLMTISGDMAEAVAEEMDGLGALSFDRVKIPAGGGIAFELPGEDEDNPESSPAIVGVILDHHPVNAYWAEKFSGGNAQPDCSSFDGKKGVFRGTGEIRDCAACPYNQFGSDGRGKACKNVHRLYILQEGNPVPIILAGGPKGSDIFDTAAAAVKAGVKGFCFGRNLFQSEDKLERIARLDRILREA